MEKTVKREIESTDRQIDALVYELYGLTKEEIKIVES
jgi:type II restriction/modification system DNA methylase subunit YeeA